MRNAQASSEQSILQRDVGMLRVTKTINLALELSAGELSYDVESFLLDLEDYKGSTQEFRDLLEAIEVGREGRDILSTLYSGGFNGVLLEVVKPVKTQINDSSYSFCWSHCEIAYIYANSYDNAINKALTWSNL